MDIHLYNSTSYKNTVSKKLENKTTFKCKMLDDVSIVNPIIQIQTIQNIPDIVKFNYAKIPQTRRFYFIDDVIIKNGYFELHLHVDVLNTYSKDIKESSQVVARQEKRKNLYLADEKLPVHADKSTTILKSVTTPFNNKIGTTDNTFLVLQTTGVEE